MGQSTAESDPTLTSLNSIALLRIFARIVPVGSKNNYVIFLPLKYFATNRTEVMMMMMLY